MVKKTILVILALLLTACLGVSALAETVAETPAEASAETSAADAAKAAADEAQAAADAAKAESDALNEALDAYRSARTEKRKLDILTSLKEELDGYVAAGSLTQEQADLILKYYAEQLAAQKDSARSGRGGKRFGRGGTGFGRGGKGFNRGGRRGRFGRTVPAQEQAPAEQGSEDT